MKIVLNRKGFFELSIKALSELADIINRFAHLNKYYVATDIYTEDVYVTLEKVKTYPDYDYETVILTDKIFNGKRIKILREEYNSLNKLSMETIFNRYNYEIRNEEMLVYVVEKLGHDANTCNSYLEVVEILDGLSWKIVENCGSESLVYGKKEAMDKINIL